GPLADAVEVAEGAEGGPVGLLGRHAASDVRLRFHLHVKTELLVDVADDGLAPAQRAQPCRENVEQSHGRETSSGGLPDFGDGERQAIPTRLLGLELIPSGPGERVELDAAAGLA